MRVLSLTALLGAFATLAALAVTAIAVARTAGAGFAGVALRRRWGHVIAGQVQVGQQCQGGCIDKVGRCIAGMVFRGAGLALAAFTAGLALAAFSTGLALTAAIAIAGRAITACLIAVFTVCRVHALWGCGGSLRMGIGYGACFGAALAAMIRAKGLPTLIQVDGGVTLDNARELFDLGADVLVSGSAFFGFPPYDTRHRAFQATVLG